MQANTYMAFLGHTRLALGDLRSVLTAAWPHRNQPSNLLLIFRWDTGVQCDFDWSGTLEEVLDKADPPAAKVGPGRPRLGVVSTEVTLLPRHWDWLNAQPARASGTLRRLVEEAMARQQADPQHRREVLGKILWALAGNQPGFEEASRALYAGDGAALKALASHWPGDLPALVTEALVDL